MSESLQVRVKRVYSAPEPAEDGVRVLVDRLWPRGLGKSEAALDAWEKEVAPSPELRKWYGHEPSRFDEFAERYRAELAGPEGQVALRRLRECAVEGEPLTLLTAVKNLAYGHPLVLAEELRSL